MGSIALYFLGCQGCSHTETDSRSNILGSGPLLALLGSPTHHRQETGAFAHVECAYTLGTVDLMSREREQIYSQVVDVERQLPRGLHSVHMQQDTALSGHLAKGGGRLNRPDFMISEANTDQHSF